MRDYLKELRLEADKTQLDVAKKLDVSESFYCLIEKGERLRDMPVSMARKIAEAFGITLETVLELEELFLKKQKK